MRAIYFTKSLLQQVNFYLGNLMGQLIHNVRGVAERVCNEIEGWLNFTTAVVTVEILNNQYQCGVKGGVLEGAVIFFCSEAAVKTQKKRRLLGLIFK